MKVIGFTGLAGSGKDTAANVLIAAGFEHVKMAGALKAMMRALFQWQGAPTADIDRWIDGEVSDKEEANYYLRGRTSRHAMQTLGTEWGRQMIDENIWTFAVCNRIEALAPKPVVISDVRFPNEVKLIQGLGGKVYRFDRGLPPTDPHPSESLVLTLDVDGVIVNDAPCAEAFETQLRVALL